jgi:hypothetical protein
LLDTALDAPQVRYVARDRALARAKRTETDRAAKRQQVKRRRRRSQHSARLGDQAKPAPSRFSHARKVGDVGHCFFADRKFDEPQYNCYGHGYRKWPFALATGNAAVPFRFVA